MTINNESKNNVTITNQDKSGNALTWDDATWTWNEATGTWDSPRIVLSKESKTNITITNETKS